jgi:hypothetical protein
MNPLSASGIIQAQELKISKLQGSLTLLFAGFRDDTIIRGGIPRLQFCNDL